MRTVKPLWVWAMYCLAVPGATRLFHKRFAAVDSHVAAHAQWVLVQAFGRSSFTDHELEDKLAEICGQKANVFRFTSLQKADFQPGPANRKLAWYCLRLWDANPGLVLELQWEVAYALWAQNPRRYVERQRLVNVIWPAGSYFATFHVVRAASADIRSRGLDPGRGINLAHQDMIARALPVAWKEGLAPVPLLAPIPYAGAGSVQLWTKNAVMWFPRELLTRVHHLAHMVLRRDIMAPKPPATAAP